MAELRRAVTNQRSRSPRRGTNQSRQLSLPGPSQLALPAPPTPKAKAGAKGSAKGIRKNKQQSKGRGKAGHGQQRNNFTGSIPSFQALMDIPRDERPHLANGTKGICFSFQSKTCTRSSCGLSHVCIGCGKADTAYDDCRCLSLCLSISSSSELYRRRWMRVTSTRLCL